ncbi:MAG TPA: NfeD family protein, partial [Pirellulaceae bacterium]|nr:NfeD family protein [Pirellulaceae bacterium]
PVHPKIVNWILRTIEDHQKRNDFNLLILNLRSGGGNVEQSLRLAQQLASLGQPVHTVAYVDWQARGDAAIIALACDELVVAPAAMIGGPGETVISGGELAVIREPLADLARTSGRDWSPSLALLDPSVELHRYTHALGGEVRYLSAEEAQLLPDADQWRRDDVAIETSRGITGLQAEELGLARGTAQNFDELKAMYQIEGTLEQVRPNWVLAAVESLANPRIAWLLLFVGIFALMFEMSTPGVGIPGLIAVVSFLLFFWSQFLHGTAGWLEILLFVAGLTCLAIEIFALPGFGVFGIGGALMVIVSIVLASQTFVVPANAYQLQQFPVSLLMVAAAMVGGIASIFVIRRFLPDTPYFNRMLLRPPEAEERLALSRREALASWEHLAGKRGVTLTPLVPAGKAQFGDELVDVVSNGEMLPKGTPVVIEEVAGSRVVVRRATG